MNKSFYVLNTPLSCFTCDCCHTKDYDYRKQIDSEKFCGIENRNGVHWKKFQKEKKKLNIMEMEFLE